MASCVYIINMIKCFPRMKLLKCHATPGYYQQGFAMFIEHWEEKLPIPTQRQKAPEISNHCCSTNSRGVEICWYAWVIFYLALFFTRVG